jgi:hypothetical protein
MIIADAHVLSTKIFCAAFHFASFDHFAGTGTLPQALVVHDARFGKKR